MKNINTKLTMLLATGLTLGLSAMVMGQPQERGGGGRQGGQMSGSMLMQMFPVMAALDADKDGTISAAEISGASAALAKLDANGDGELTFDEIRPQRFQGGRGGGRGMQGRGMQGRGMQGRGMQGGAGKGGGRGGMQSGGEGGARRSRPPADDE